MSPYFLKGLAEKLYERIREYELKMRELKEADFEHALERMKRASTGDMVRKYEEWNERFGAL